MRCARLLVFLSALAGCDRGLATAQADLAAAQRDEQRLLALLGQLTRQQAQLKQSVQAEESRASRANAALRELQVSTVEAWKGEPAKLAELKRGVTLLPSLAGALDTAQALAGGEAVEKRFARAVTANDPAPVGGLLDGWERHWLDAHAPDEEEAPAKVCPTTRTLACTAIDDDSLWCPDSQERSAWAMLLDNGALQVAQLQAGQSHEVVSRLAPRVWLTRVGKGEQAWLFLHALKGARFVTVWQSRTEKAGVRLEQHQANLDEDAFAEGLFWSAEELLLADPTSRDDVTLLRDARACEALALVEVVPPPVRERCARLLAPPSAAGGGPDGG